MDMDLFTAGSISSRVAAIDARKSVERRLEKCAITPDGKADAARRFDRSEIKRTIPEQPREFERELSGGEKSLYDLLKDEIERLRTECESSAANGDADKTAEVGAGCSDSGEKTDGTEKTKSPAEWLYDQVRTYESGEKTDPDKSVSDWVKEQMEIIDRMNAQREYDKRSDLQIGSINNKLNCGQKLTATEKQYLLAHDPIAYQNAQQIENERKYYAKMLCCCRTKDDVNAMRMSCSLSALAELKKLKSGGDTESLSRIIQRNAALESELNSFVRRGGYSALPTAAECRKVAADLRKARRYEQEKKRAKEAERKKSAEAKRKAKKYKKNPGDGKQTVSQVLRSPTARKVRRSMAKGAYLRCAAAQFHVVRGRGGLNGRG